MKHIYEVEYEFKAEGVGDWMKDSIQVLGNSDGQQAVDRARKHVIGTKVEVDDSGKKKKITHFRLIGLDRKAQAEI